MKKIILTPTMFIKIRPNRKNVFWGFDQLLIYPSNFKFCVIDS